MQQIKHAIHLNAEDKVIDIFKKDDKLQQSEMDENNDRYYVDEFFYVTMLVI